MATRSRGARVQFRLRITKDEDIAVGPGKIDLLEAIAATGSITAAAKRLGMSYRRAWLLVDTMNRCFRAPVVEAEAGGVQGGGTALTPLGAVVVRRYRDAEALAASAAEPSSRRSALLREGRRAIVLQRRHPERGEGFAAQLGAREQPPRSPRTTSRPLRCAGRGVVGEMASLTRHGDALRCPGSPPPDPMDIAFILDPLRELKAYKDSSIAMMRELARRGHRIFALEQGDLFWDAGVTRARARPLELFADDHAWHREGPEEVRRLTEFAADDHAQGPAVRHGVRVLDVPARMRGARGRARVQPSARDPRPQREARDREVRRLHLADAGDARRGAHRAVHRRARGRRREAARRHGRHVGVPRAARRTPTAT